MLGSSFPIARALARSCAASSVQARPFILIPRVSHNTVQRQSTRDPCHLPSRYSLQNSRTHFSTSASPEDNNNKRNSNDNINGVCKDGTSNTSNISPFYRTIYHNLFNSFAVRDPPLNATTSTTTSPSFLRVEDLRDLLACIGEHPSDALMHQIFDDLDTDRSGYIDFEEFIVGADRLLQIGKHAGGQKHVSEHVLDLDLCRKQFDLFDTNGDGWISTEELKSLSTTTLDMLTDEEVQTIMNEFATAGKEGLDWFQFLAIFQKPNSPISWRLRSAFRAFIICGGPGTGKGTQCHYLKSKTACLHVSTGELLRNEMTKKNALADDIRNIMQRGGLVDSAIIMALLRKYLSKVPGRYVLIDGFPRNVANANDYIRLLGKPFLAINLTCSEDEMVRRILHRGETSGRSDDNEETARKRIETYKAHTLPLLDYFVNENVGVYNINAEKEPEQVFQDIISQTPIGKILKLI